MPRLSVMGMLFRGTGYKMDSCIEWQGNRSDKNYGRQWSTELNRYERATHVVLREEGIDVPSGMCVMHICDNPPCVNPDHLEIGTHADNMRDMKEKGRAKSGGAWKSQPGEINGLAKLTENNVRYIRKVYHPRHSQFGARALARELGVSHTAISKAAKGENWSHL